ncbi:hypothetical protein [Solitalea koreensis]|uniref:hypothetical protein n=1 Tax=Solitalea koreensis TaxID=543615 RepID=UPI00163DC31A|nr:hypothetical protein [Solitalea koreensis]
MKKKKRPSIYFFMHNLKANFDKFFDITKSVFSAKLLADNKLQPYRRTPKLSNCEIIALALSAESIGIDSENYFFEKLKAELRQDFTQLIHRCNFNRRRKRLAPFIRELNEQLASRLNEGENVYLVDSIPVPMCQLAREKRSKICKETFESAPDKGYSAVQKSYYYGYKLHLVTSLKGGLNMDLRTKDTCP